MVKKLSESPCFLAGDLTHLRELLHPSKEDVRTLFSLAHAYLEAGESSLPHRLAKSSETYFVLEGSGLLHLDGKAYPIGANDTFHVPANGLQSVENTGDTRLSFLCVVSPPWSPEDEIVYAAAPQGSV